MKKSCLVAAALMMASVLLAQTKIDLKEVKFNYPNIEIFDDISFESFHYSAETVRRLAEDNATGITQWVLYPYGGTSLLEQHEHTPFQETGWRWWLRSGDKKWREKKSPAGYYFLNIKGMLANFKAEDKQADVEYVYGPKFESCPPQILSEFLSLTHFSTIDWFHVTKEKSAAKRLVSVGMADEKIKLISRDADDQSQRLRVVVMRAWDF